MEKLRLSLLAVIFGSVFYILGKTIVPQSTANINSFVFPKAVPLSAWQLQKSRPMDAPIAKIPSYLFGRHYQYIQNNLMLDIEMRYLVNTPGDVKYFIRFVPPLPGQLTLASLRQQQGVGFYYLFTHQQRAYLSTCINSRGGSTVTVSQFQQNRYLYDINLGRLVPWLLGQEPFQDKRCLWAQLSIPLNNSPGDTYQTLEKAWFDWYRWWHPRFPQY